MTKKSNTPNGTDMIEKPPESDLVPNFKGSDMEETKNKTPHLTHQQVTALLDTNDSVRRVIAILINGKRSLGKPQAFPLHDPLLQQMDRARRSEEKGREDIFLVALEKYLKMIPAFTPQTGRPEQAPLLVGEVMDLILREDVGFLPVANKILSVLNAPA